MKYSQIKLSEKYSDALLECYIHSPYEELAISKRKAIIVCPGGGYQALSEREAEPVALQYFAAGLNAFILRYSINEKAADYAPLIEACLAIKYVRDHSEEFCVDTDYVYITGFSAGGHLAAWAGTQWHIDRVREAINGSDISLCKPTATVLCYPVITSFEYAHRGSIYVLNGFSDDPEGMSRFSLEKFVDGDTSPAFLWHTAQDMGVPVQNSLLYASQLAEHKFPFELHIYPTGNHGLSLCNKETWSKNPDMLSDYNRGWIDKAIKWVTEAPFKK